VPLDGVKFLWGGHTPAAIHEGGGTSMLIVDSGATSEQRASLDVLRRGGGVGSPFDEFASVTDVWYDVIVAPIEMEFDGINSKAKVGGGSIFELDMERVKNPVTREEEITILEHPTGFTSTRSELGTSKVARLVSEYLTYDHAGKYAEYAEFSYHGP
jgi:hypothetical protein